VDKTQNLVLLEGAEINDYTILKFKRKILTCDKSYDKEITVRLQWFNLEEFKKEKYNLVWNQQFNFCLGKQRPDH
jgi:hypothetical protein